MDADGGTLEKRPSPMPMNMPAIREAQLEELSGEDVEERKGPAPAGAGAAGANADDAESVDDSDDDRIDSGRNVLSNGEDYNMSDIEEDKNYMEEVKQGIEYESDCSIDSDIPEEHENGYGFNEYLRRYILNMKLMTWNRDSQGLFDYETRHCQKLKLTTDKSCQLVRKN